MEVLPVCMYKVVLLILLPHTEPESYTKAIECLIGGTLSANQWVIEQDSNREGSHESDIEARLSNTICTYGNYQSRNSCTYL